MFHPLKPFVAWAIAWKSNDFLRARLKLTGLYVLLLAAGLTIISAALLIGVSYRLEQAANEGNIRVTLAQARTIASDFKPDVAVTEVLLENEQGRLSYKALFDDDTEIIVDPFTGEPSLERESYESFTDAFYEDFEEMVWMLDAVLLLISTGLSYFLAGKTLEPIARKMRQQKQFTADAAHELRNPLAAIRSTAESALHATRSEHDQCQEIFEDIVRESDHLIVTAEHLLSLARYDEGALVKKDVLLHEVVTSVVQSVEPFAKERGVCIRHDVSPFLLKGDATGLRSLVFNLLHNAIKFSKPGGEVSVSLSSRGELRVQDRGSGIEAANIPKVFNRFYSEDASHSSGSGLGLSVVQSIVYAHGANIDVVSEKGKGATFTVEF